MTKQQLTIELFQAYYDARRHKRNKPDAIRFELNYEQNLLQLADEIWKGTYQPGSSTCFVVNQPVKREIFAAAFRDRIVHHFVYNQINPIFEKKFINDCYSCRLGKGTSYGIKRLEHFVRSCSESYNKDCYVLKLDLSGYFMSINKKILYNIVRETVSRDKKFAQDKNDFKFKLIMNLLKKIIFHDPTVKCRVKGRREDWAGLPRSKSLFFARAGCGLPIGNLTSQLFGNVYLNQLDHFIKNFLGCRHYGRYVDDMIFAHNDKVFLKNLVPEIRNYLFVNLKLKLHEKKIYLQIISRGIKFLGAYILPHRTYIDNRSKGNFYAKIRKWNTVLEKIGNKLNGEQIKKIISCANSYLGLMMQHKTYQLRRQFYALFSVYFWNYICIERGFLMKRTGCC
jgi:RNA-directed DNA polymerase